MGTKERQNKEVGIQKPNMVLINLLRLPTHEFFQLILPIKLSSIPKNMRSSHILSACVVITSDLTNQETLLFPKTRMLFKP
jgi:hypothetical protein